MSQLVYKFFLKKVAADKLLQIGPSEDPYFEPIPENELHFYQRKGAVRKRKLPDIIPSSDLKILESVKRKAYRLDLQLSLCGLRLGWAGVIGLLPWIGDAICFCLALQLIKKADSIEGGLPPALKQKMTANAMIDFGFGLVPIVGDLINIMYKCNSRNFILLEKYLVDKYTGQVPVKVGTSGADGASPNGGKPPLPPRLEP